MGVQSLLRGLQLGLHMGQQMNLRDLHLLLNRWNLHLLLNLLVLHLHRRLLLNQSLHRARLLQRCPRLHRCQPRRMRHLRQRGRWQRPQG